MEIYNLRGQLVKTLVNQEMQRGDHQLVWNGDDAAGRPVSAGIYICRMKAGNRQQARKLLKLSDPR